MQSVSNTWTHRYGELIAALPQLVAGAKLTLCGMSACIDARVSMHDMQALFDADDPAAAAFAGMLVSRAGRGIGGELSVDWPDGPAWLAAHVPVRTAFGGTGPHAAAVLTALGAPALLCLGDRSAHMLEHVPRDILLAEGGRLVRAQDLVPRGERRPEIFIIEYTAGLKAGPVVPERSSRIIVRFDNLGLEDDASFDRLTPGLAAEAGAGLLAGFNAVPEQDLGREIERVFGLAGSWRAAGLDTVHLELAGYDSPALLAAVLRAARGTITSIGMSQSELAMVDASADDTLAAMTRLGDRLDGARVCVHADHWAAAVTIQDPDAERQALMAGCLLASARAATGHPVRPQGVDPAARFHPLPFPEQTRRGGWSLVACASPYLAQPATTLGLGDTFTAGCLLALGQARGRNRQRSRASA